MNVESIVYDLFGEITRLRERIHEYTGHWKQNSKSRRAAQKLHKPFTNIVEVLDDICQFKPKLPLCCILTYGCLL
jgi:hypothetical protein